MSSAREKASQQNIDTKYLQVDNSEGIRNIVSGVAKNLQAFVSHTQSINLEEMVSNTNDQNSKAKASRNQTDRDFDLPRQQSRQSSEKPKQVRFDIKAGLQHMVKESNIDLDQVSPRSLSNNRSQTLKNSIVRKQSKSPNNQQAKQKLPPSSHQAKLAMQYKREAEQNRNKKHNFKQQEEVIQTPDFSLLVQQKDPEDNYLKSEGTLSPKMIMKRNIKPQEIDQQYLMKQERIPITQSQQQQQQQLQSIGTIVRRNEGSQSRELSHSVSLQHISMVKPGMIMRQRSTSPADAISLTRNKENQSMMMNTTALAGQIVKLQSQRLNSTQNDIIIKPIEKSPQVARASQPQVKSILKQESIKVHHYNNQPIRGQIVRQHVSQQEMIDPFFQSIWQAFKLDSNVIEAKIKNALGSMLNDIKKNFHYKLDQEMLQSDDFNFQTFQIERQRQCKLTLIRQTLKILCKEKFYFNILEIMELKEKLTMKRQDLKKAIKANFKRSERDKFNPQSMLKVEILSDICSRLTQKMTLKILSLNSGIKSNTHQLFNLYNSIYLVKPLISKAFTFLKAYFQKQREKKQYLYYVKRQVSDVRIQQIFYSWKTIKQSEVYEAEAVEEAKSILYSRKMSRVIAGWKAAIIEERSKVLNEQIIEKYQMLRYYHRLFIRWVNANRQNSKIKRKAAMMVSQMPGSNQMKSNKSQDEWYKDGLQKADEIFHSQIQEMILEKEHNANFIESLKYKTKIEELNERFPEHLSQVRKESNFVQTYNNERIYSKFPELKHSPKKRPISRNSRFESPRVLSEGGRRRNSINQDPVEIKYSIHSALVQQQNSQKKINQSYSQICHSDAVSIAQKTPSQAHQYKQLLPPVPQRLFQQQKQQQVANIKPLAPNMFFEKLERQMASVKKEEQFNNYIDKHSLIPLVIQVKEHITQLRQNLTLLERLPIDYHFSVALKQTTNSQGDTDSYYGVNDYIQNALQSDSSRMVFIQMFKNRVISKLFTQWKVAFLKKWLRNDLKQLSSFSIAKQSMIEWAKIGRHREQKVYEFQRTKQMQKFYTLFRKWASANRNLVLTEIKLLRQFRKRVFFKVWVQYMENQGHLLQRILRSQQYYQQALTSKALLAMYQFYLKQIRIKRFQKKKVFKKFFKKLWMVKYKQMVKLRAITAKIEDKVQLQERLRYQQEYEIMKDVMQSWKSRVNDRQKLIKHLTALNHYKSSLIARSFIAFKRVFMYSQGVKKLEYIVRNSCLNPAFQRIKRNSKILLTNEQALIKYRSQYLLQQVMMKWRESILKNQLVQMMIKKRIWKNWKRYTQMRNHILPQEYREKRQKATFLNELKIGLKRKWIDQRSDIIIRSMQRKRVERRLKICFLKLLENILEQKKQRIIKSTVTDFRNHNLREKAYQELKERWIKRSKRRMMKRVAKEFRAKIMKRRYLRQQQFYEGHGFNRHLNEDQMFLSRIFTQWSMISQDRHRKQTVLMRFITYKRNFLKLRCFLGWKSIVQYEQSFNSSIITRNLPMQSQTSKVSTQGADGGYVHTDQTHLSRPQYEKAFTDLMKQQPIPSESPYKMELGMRGGGGNSDKKGDQSLFDELEHIFEKNKRWLDEQREREEFLREMASQYNQRLSQEMSTLLYSTDKQKQYDTINK